METKLSIVNHLLRTVGERRVSTLNTGHPSVVQAIDALESHDRDFQARGWWFNTNRDVTLTQNNRGEVLIPETTLEFTVTASRLHGSSPADKSRYVKRGNRIYDSHKNTFEIGFPLYADMVIQLPIEDLPHVAAAYLKHMAAEAFFVDDDGDITKANKLNEHKTLAWHALKAAEMKALSTNALDSPAARELTYRIRSVSTSTNPMLPGGRFR
ncbi:tail protein [Nostoc phage NMeng1]|nr:tail protein [Nostoc phage NMeng1]